MRKLMVTTMVISTFVFSIPIASANACQGDASHSTPPIPNYPTHIRNVIWRNTRALCLAELSQAISYPPPSPLKKPVDQKPVN
jgi:hypothetical protein